MGITTEIFGAINGADVTLYTLDNSLGLRACITNVNVISVFVPNKNIAYNAAVICYARAQS